MNNNYLSDEALFRNSETDSGTSGTSPPPPPAKFSKLEVDGVSYPETTRWAYRDADGNVIFYVQRFDLCGGAKQFRPLRRVNGQWSRKAPDEPRPLYGLDKLAARPDAPVMVCEGEKAADAAQRLHPDWVAVTSLNGAKSAAKTDWAPLAGRDVYIWPDQDPPGADYAAKVAELVTAAGAVSCHTLKLVGLFTLDGFTPSWEVPPEGWDAADAESEGLTAAVLATADSTMLWEAAEEAAAEEAAAGADAPADKPLPPDGRLPEIGFKLIEFWPGWRNGVYWQGPPEKEGDRLPLAIWLCSPLTIVAETRSADQTGWGRLLAWCDPDGHAHQWAMPLELLAGRDTSEVRQTLVDGGLLIATGAKHRDKLSDYIATIKPSSADRLRCVDKIGWHNGQYVTPTRSFGPDGGETVIFQGQRNQDFNEAGTLAQWQTTVAAMAIGNSRIAFAISTAFAGPLVDLANESGGGFQFTGKTSGGKTSCCIDPAASVWGNPSRFAKRWRTTVNGLEALCLSRNDSILILDDLGQADARECGQAAYLIANGQGKIRQRKEGGNRETTTWRTMLLSSGEVDLGQFMTEGGGTVRGGQSIRLPSIPADAGAGLGVLENLHGHPDGRHFADALAAATRQYCGTAGATFLERLTENLAEARAEIREAISGLVAKMPIPAGAAPEVGRVAARFALVGYSGDLATRCGVTGWQPGAAVQAAFRCFSDWLRDAGGALGADSRALLQQVAAFLQANLARFPHHECGSEELHRVQNRAGFTTTADDGGERHYWVESGAFRRELCRGYNPISAAKALLAAGWLVPGGDKKNPYQQRKRVAALGQGQGIWVYVIRAEPATGGEL